MLLSPRIASPDPSGRSPHLMTSMGVTVYADLYLPFGLQSAPKIFTTFADLLEWVLFDQGLPFLLHYLDDSFFILCSSQPGCRRSQSYIMLSMLVHLNVPASLGKLEGPSSVTFLGIVLDTVRFELPLPTNKEQ